MSTDVREDAEQLIGNEEHHDFTSEAQVKLSSKIDPINSTLDV